MTIVDRPITGSTRSTTEFEFAGGRAGEGLATWGQVEFFRQIEGYGDDVHAMHLVLRGPVRPGVPLRLIRRYITALVLRYESLRTMVWRDAEGVVRQRVVGDGAIPVEIATVQREDEIGRAADELCDELFHRRFDTGHDLPIRIGYVVRQGRVRHSIMVLAHTAVDGTAANRLARQLVAASTNPLAARRLLASPPPRTPLDEAAHQQSEAGRRQHAKASRRIVDELSRAPLPAFPASTATPEYRKAVLRSSRMQAAVATLAERYECSPSTLILAAAVHAIAVGLDRDALQLRMLVNNRFMPDLADAMSTIAQATPLVVREIGAESTFVDVLQRVRKRTMSAFRNAYCDGEQLDRDLAAAGVGYDDTLRYNDHLALGTGAWEYDFDVADGEIAWVPTVAGHPDDRALSLEVHDAGSAIDLAMTIDTTRMSPEEGFTLLKRIDDTLSEEAAGGTAETGAPAPAADSGTRTPSTRRDPSAERTGTSPNGDRPSWLHRLGVWSSRRSWSVILSSALLTVVAFLVAVGGITGQTLFMRLDNGAPSVNGEAQRAEDLLTAAEGDRGTPLRLLVYGVDPLDDSLDAPLTDLVGAIDGVEAEHPGAELTIADPREGIGAIEAGAALPADDAAELQQATSADGNGFLLTVTLEVADTGDPAADRRTHSQAEKAALAALDSAAERIRAEHADATVHVSSENRIAGSYRVVAAADLERGELIALPIALLIMILVFGGLLAAGIPILGAVASIGAGMGALFVISLFVGFDSMVINVLSLLGLGLAIDYGLLIISRFREEIDADGAADRERLAEAIGRTVDHAGRTVIFSGALFITAALGLTVFEPAIMKAIGFGVIIVVVLAALFAVVLIPAILGRWGRRVAGPGFLVRWLGADHPISRLGRPAPEEGVFGSIAKRVQRRPGSVTLASTALLALIAAPALAMIPTNDVSGALPRAASQYGFVETIEEKFPDAARAEVKIVVGGGTPEANAAQADAWVDRISNDAAIERIGVHERVGDYATVLIRPADGQERAAVEAARSAAPEDAQAWVTGSAAHDVDLIDSVAGSVPLAAATILVLGFILLFLMSGSVIIPLKSLLISALSLSAAVGVLVWGFQMGNLAGLLNFHAEDVSGVDVLVLTITLILGFGLSMDYEVFLLGRVIELRDQGYGGRESIRRGVQGTGRIITSAALVMVVVFLGFTFGDLLVIKQMGLALALLVALDATLVRLVLVPALMTWQERWMWWAPRWLEPVATRFRIHH